MTRVNKQRLDQLRQIAIQSLSLVGLSYSEYSFNNYILGDDLTEMEANNLINNPSGKIEGLLGMFWNERKKKIIGYGDGEGESALFIDYVLPFQSLNYQSLNKDRIPHHSIYEIKGDLKDKSEAIVAKSFYRLYLAECVGKQILFNKKVLTTTGSDQANDKKVFWNDTEVSISAHLSAIEISELKKLNFDFEKIRAHYYCKILNYSNLDNINLSDNDFEIEKREGENFIFKLKKDISEIQLYKFLKKELPDNVIFSIDVEKDNSIKFTVHCNNLEALKEANKQNKIIRFFKAVFYCLFCCCFCISRNSRKNFLDKLVNDIQVNDIQKSNTSFDNPNFDDGANLPSAPIKQNYMIIASIEEAKDFIIEAKIIEKSDSMDYGDGVERVNLKIQINFNCNQDLTRKFIVMEFPQYENILINDINKTATFDLFIEQDNQYANLNFNDSILNEIKSSQNYKDTYKALNEDIRVQPSAPPSF